jgi:hypothetical protein
MAGDYSFGLWSNKLSNDLHTLTMRLGTDAADNKAAAGMFRSTSDRGVKPSASAKTSIEPFDSG